MPCAIVSRPSPPSPRLLTLLACTVGLGCSEPKAEADYRADRLRMVSRQIVARGVRDTRVLAAMRRVERHRFVPAGLRQRAYGDHPLPIGKGQTISQPYVVAAMTEALRIRRDARVLEIGTGSGYQAAILGELAARVYTIEIVPELGRRARKLLRQLGYRNISVRIGDGYAGWPARAPFDAVVVTAAPPQIPKLLLEQLRVGGVLVAPVGRPWQAQSLVRVTRTRRGFRRERLFGVRFVPMTGRAQQAERPKPAGR